jgi:hypothetical protein
MQVFIHRINTITDLKNIPTKYGVEIDIRGDRGELLLTHDPVVPTQTYDTLEDYLRHFKHAGIIFNLKEAGYEQTVIDLAKKFNIENYFLLDVEFPYLYRATRKEGVRKIAIRYSEAEPIEAVEAQMQDDKPLLDWVWIDTNTKLPIDTDTVNRLRKFKTCLVCPDRWGRPQDIDNYAEQMKKFSFVPTAIMTTFKYAEKWEKMYT